VNFNNAGDLRAVIEQMRLLNDTVYSPNQARINMLANGEPPYTQSEQLENNLDTNVNFLEFTRAVADARKTWYGAMLKGGRYFTISVDMKDRRAATWSSKITKAINKVLKDSLFYTELKQATGAQVVLHGIGPSSWEDPYEWCPEEIGIEDLLIPSGTCKNLRNLKMYAIYRKRTSTQLYEMTHGSRRDPGWRMNVVNAELERLSKEWYGTGMTDARDLRNPVKLAEIFKAQSGYMNSDAVPTVNCWDCYWQGEKEDSSKWFKAILLDTPEGSGGFLEDDFLYKSVKPVADKREHLLHINFGDGANKVPFLYHSIRGFGFLAYGPGHLQNRLRSRINDCIFENSVMGFRIQNADDRSRVNKIDLFQKGIMLVPQGVEIIPESERRSVNQELVFAGLAQNRQLIGEAAAQYIQDVEQGSTREQTATEVMAKVNSANAIVSGMLLMAYEYDEHQDKEVCRRFCLKGSSDPDVKKFQEQMRNEGVPEEALNFERWNVQKERALGGGNKMLAIAQADKLMAVRGMHDPDAQREILHMYDEVNTDNPDLADRLVPPSPPPLSKSRHEGQLAAGAIMQGLPVQPLPGTNHIDYVEALLTAMASTIKLVEATGGMATKEQVIGLGALSQAIQAELQLLSQDPQAQEKVKEYAKALGEMTNMIKGYAQKLQQQQAQAQEQQNGAADKAKVQATLIGAATKAKVKEADAAQKRQHKQVEFAEGQKRKDIETALEARRDMTQAAVDAHATDLKTAAEIRATAAKAAAAPETTTSE
jgi:hypothetical protein